MVNRKSEQNKKRVPRYEIEEYEDAAKSARVLSTYNKVKLKNEKQVELVDGILTNTITTISGPPGSGKTFCACYAALTLFNQKNSPYNKIYLVKPLETSGEETGFLPGDLKAKVEPYMQSFIDNFSQMMPGMDLKSYIDTKAIEFIPAAYVRGRTLRNCIILLDECQNFDVKQLMTLVTRLGDKSKMVFMGDQRQNDINKRFLSYDFFRHEILEGVEDVFTIDFDRSDIVRHPMLIKITDNYERLEKEGKLPNTKNKN